MKKKIVLIPLDERPCNRLFPERLFSKEEFDIISPGKLGEKKKPADTKEIADFLRRECKDADGLILSVDMLLYGGLIPSRLHHETKETLIERLQILKEIREENENLLIYAFQVIMRCPDYSSDDEEPDYYQTYGKQIHEAGVAVHKSRLGIYEENQIGDLIDKIDPECLNDYIARREVNRYMNVETLQYLRDGFIDALVIPQDDSARYGYAAMDQRSIREKIAEYHMADKVLMYPGADEGELTLLARMMNFLHQKRPKVYVKYASDASRSMTPLYEGAMLSVTIKYHILSAGCQMTDSYEYADIVLAITAPSDHMEEATAWPSWKPEYNMERNLAELMDFVKECLREKKIVTIADNAYANGGDLDIIRMLNQNQLLMQIGGYAGWNTSANTIGTAIAEGVNVFYGGNKKQHDDFLVERYLEDAGYCSVVRREITEQLPEEMNYFDVKESDGAVSRMVQDSLKRFARTELSSIASHIQIKKVAMPWKRMFEVDLEAEYQNE